MSAKERGNEQYNAAADHGQHQMEPAPSYLADEPRGPRRNVVHHFTADAAAEAQNRQHWSAGHSATRQRRISAHQRDTGLLLLSSTVRKRASNSASILPICSARNNRIRHTCQQASLKQERKTTQTHRAISKAPCSAADNNVLQPASSRTLPTK
jgi:hypothetical protein